jgi:hypothetical protein
MTNGAESQVGPIFNGRYTVENTTTGDHRTFQIRTQKEKAKFAPGKRVLALLTGPNNEEDYTGFAFVSNRGIRVWKSKRREGDNLISKWEWYAKMLWEIVTEGQESSWHRDGYRLLLEGSCVRCNRPLTEPESIKTGIGPVCAGRKA